MGKDKKGSPYRGFVTDEGFLKNRSNHDINNYYRYEKLFADSQEKALSHFADIPFLNGGLFECLDKRDDDKKTTYYLDGFSRNAKKRPRVPDRLFFDSGEIANLSEAYGDTKRKAEKVTGLITILNRYKFTIVENTPIDQEIALDPELLGKVFENLLASYNEETKTTARKQTGSFYTPRPIVDYMVDESLKAHMCRRLTEKACMKEDDAKAGLDLLFTYTEKNHPFSKSQVATLVTAIDEVKILDPACGSGAFPMGVLHKLVYILGKLDKGNEKWRDTQIAKVEATIRAAEKIDDVTIRDSTISDLQKQIANIRSAFSDNELDYGRKLYLIENCLYGVDIQPIAIQITKLRFFISLVCDQKTNQNKDKNHGVRPLPNLETKFVAANTLIYPEFEEMATFNWQILNPLRAQLAQVRHDYFGAQNRQVKKRLKENDKRLRNEIANTIFAQDDDTTFRDQLAHWDPYDATSVASFFDPAWMFGRQVSDGFDVTIGNPPYVRADEQSEANQDQRKAILASKRYETLWEKWDLYVAFIERSYKLLLPHGVSTMIVSDAFCHSKYAQKAQNWFLQNSRILRLDFCGEVKIFDAAVHNVITSFQKTEGANSKPLRRLHRESFGEVTELPTDEQSSLTYRTFFPEDTPTEAFDCKSIMLDAICYISVGMVVHADEKVAKGAFELEDLVSDSQDILHPRRFVEGKHLARWFSNETKWLEWGTARAPHMFRRKTFPELYEVDEKIFIHRTGGEGLRSSYDDEKTLCNHTVMVCLPWSSLERIRNKSIKKAARYRGETPPRPDLPKREELEVTSRRFAMKYLLGVMNSSSARDFLRANRRSNTDLYPEDWKKLPIPDVSVAQQKPIVALVNQILTLKRDNPSANIKALEAQIDVVVAKLYGLTPEEIAIVEGTAK